MNNMHCMTLESKVCATHDGGLAAVTLEAHGKGFVADSARAGACWCAI